MKQTDKIMSVYDKRVECHTCHAIKTVNSMLVTSQWVLELTLNWSDWLFLAMISGWGPSAATNCSLRLAILDTISL